MSSPQVPFLRSGLIMLSVLALVAGCGSSTPRTYPVKGKVVFKEKGGVIRQLAGGKVWFQSVSDPRVKAMGEIEDSGAFTMDIVHQEKNVSGVPAGQYKARVDPPPDDNEGKPRRGLFHPRFQEFDQSKLVFTVPSSDAIVIELERTARSSSGR